MFLLAALPRSRGELPWELRDPSWRTDPVWHDGLAEVATYEATRSIYGAERRFVARAYTNKQALDRARLVKAEDPARGDTLEVFKHHWSERVPTEAYDYDFSTAAFLRTDDLRPVKLTVATQEDCGASFKQVESDGEGLRWIESVYHPGGGLAQGWVEEVVPLQDALTLALRDFPFDELEPGSTRELTLLPSQKDPHRRPFEPEPFTLTWVGRERVEVPAGSLECFHLRLEREQPGEPPTDFWFATEGSAPWLHVLVQLEGPEGVSYRLASLERAAYWARPAAR